MIVIIQAPIGGEAGLAEIDVLPTHTIGEIKHEVCTSFGLDSNTVALMYGGEVLDDSITLGQLGITEFAQLALMPYDLIGGIDDKRLEEENSFLKAQFPLVGRLDPTAWQGMLRCEKGPVKELADKNIWPFTDYIKWHTFRMEVPPVYPYKFPTVTWLTPISHPNIIPNIPGKVCVSILGEKWNPSITLPAVVNALYFLLTDPNPMDTYNPEIEGPIAQPCVLAAKVCAKHNFPKRKVGEKPPIQDQ